MERLSGLDAAFLYLETPTHHLHVAATMVLDPSTMPGGYSFEKIKDFIGARLHRVAPFRRRIMEVPFRVHHPVWIEDPDFDLDHHIRRIGAPAPGGRRELGMVTAQIASTQLDRSHPLWELWVVEGLKHDRIGVVTKIHHAAIDGASGAEIMVNLFDLEPVVELPEAPVTEPDHIPTSIELLGYGMYSRVKRNLGILPLLGSTMQSVNRVAQGRRSPERLVGAAPLTAPRAPWNGALGARRDVGLAGVPLDDVKAIKDHFGVTVNDVVLALVGGALRRYLEQHGGVPDEPLVAACPVSVRNSQHQTGGNKISAMFTSLATDIDDPGERVRAIHASTKGAKEEHNAVGADMLQNWAEFAGPNLHLAARLYTSLTLADNHRPLHNLIISNVPGPDVPLYYAGAELVAAYPMGPAMEGAGLNVTVMSYRGSIDIGFMVDEAMVPDVWTMADAVQPALDELLAATRPAGRKKPATKKAGPAKKATKRKAVAAKRATPRTRASASVTQSPRTPPER